MLTGLFVSLGTEKDRFDGSLFRLPRGHDWWQGGLELVFELGLDGVETVR